MSEAGMPKWRTDQEAYDIGYDEAGSDPKKDFPHLTFINAYFCGASDAQNHAPKNSFYRREDYDPDTFERLPQPIEGLTEEERRYYK